MANLSEIVNWLKDREQRAVAEAEQFAQEHLPVLAKLAEHAATNPLIEAAMNAAHVNPAILAGLADTLNKFEADLAAALPPETPAGTDAEPDAEPDAAAPAA
jgi:hypothetical protein